MQAGRPVMRLRSGGRSYKQDPDDLGNRVAYAFCLIVRNRGDDEARGLSELYHLADHESSSTASFYLADYLETDGEFGSRPNTRKNLDQAIRRYLRALAIIDLIPDYPFPDYIFHEAGSQIHLYSFKRVPYLYLEKYKFGAVGDYRIHQLQSPEYDGPRDKERYPEYNGLMWDSLEKGLFHAEQCLVLQQRHHFDPNLYGKAMKTCPLYADLFRTLMPLEEKRSALLIEPRCYENLTRANYPEYWETHLKINSLIVEKSKQAYNIYTGGE